MYIYRHNLRIMKKIFTLFVLTVFWASSNAQNPYLPLWEYVPDGEPYVFEDPDKPGEYRVYIYGSHDTMKDAYCGRDQIVWSASSSSFNHAST